MLILVCSDGQRLNEPDERNDTDVVITSRRTKGEHTSLRRTILSSATRNFPIAAAILTTATYINPLQFIPFPTSLTFFSSIKKQSTGICHAVLHLLSMSHRAHSFTRPNPFVDARVRSSEAHFGSGRGANLYRKRNLDVYFLQPGLSCSLCLQHVSTIQ
jgi:hypothetical protein